MILVSKTYWTGMPFWFRKNPEHARSESLVLRAQDLRQFRAVCWTPTDARPASSDTKKTGVVLMHPRVDFTHHYAIPRLTATGFTVLGAMTRGGGSDTMITHEEMLLDVGAAIRFLKEKRGCEKIVLFGNSGGGSLAAYYQASAPAMPADLMVYVAAHPGQGMVLLQCIDPSVTDERDPLSVDPDLDMYDPKNGFRAPPEPSHYSPEFLVRYRAAQRARVKRIDDTATAMLEDKASAAREMADAAFPTRPPEERRAVERRGANEPLLTVYRTMANPNYVDLSLEPSGRDYGSLLSERPDLMNYAALGFARTCTAKAWLSTWSGLSSKADLERNVKSISAPSLLVNATRDREVMPADAKRVFEAMASSDKRLVEMNARHYFEAEPGDAGPGDADEMLDVVIPWIRERVA